MIKKGYDNNSCGIGCSNVVKWWTLVVRISITLKYNFRLVLNKFMIVQLEKVETLTHVILDTKIAVAL